VSKPGSFCFYPTPDGENYTHNLPPIYTPSLPPAGKEKLYTFYSIKKYKFLVWISLGFPMEIVWVFIPGF
jgi:hypothetical protein